MLQKCLGEVWFARQCAGSGPHEACGAKTYLSVEHLGTAKMLLRTVCNAAWGSALHLCPQEAVNPQNVDSFSASRCVLSDISCLVCLVLFWLKFVVKPT